MLTQKMLDAAKMHLKRGFDAEDPFSIDLQCDICGAIKNMPLEKVKKATSVSCKSCAGKQKLIDSLESRYGRVPYRFIGNYVDSQTKIKVACKDCDFEFEISPRQMISNSSYPGGAHPCINCTARRIANRELSSFYDCEIRHFGKIKHVPIDTDDFSLKISEKIEFRCTKCDTIFKALPILLCNSDEPYCPICNPVEIEKIEKIKIKNISDEEIKKKKSAIFIDCSKSRK